MSFLTLDFETTPIAMRPEYPPRPVGVAIMEGGEACYLAWGHPTANNCSESHAVAVLSKIFDSDVNLVFHNAKFDLAVAVERLGLRMPHWDRVHDTMLLAFLADPHGPQELKELANVHLGMPPDERDVLFEWLIAHKSIVWKAYGENPTRRKAAKFTSLAPGDLVGDYAIGDVRRTTLLFKDLRELVSSYDMLPAYDRERRLMPILMENERRGLRIDVERLGDDVLIYRNAFSYAENWLRQTLRADGLNFDADDDVVDYLISRGVVREDAFGRTAKGKYSVAKNSLTPDKFTGALGPDIAAALSYRNRLKTCLSMFMEPWLAQAQVNRGRISTNWNQIRGPNGGTRTGRPSTNNHNFLNISKSFADKHDGYAHPVHLDPLPELPLCRGYVLPEERHVFLHRDFDGQELRVFAHFECGQLKAAYLKDAGLDPHNFVGERFMEVADREMSRTQIKALNFQGLYGGGAPALASALNISFDEARLLKKFHNDALPGRRILVEEITRLARAGLPIRTLGGRLYLPEAPGLDGRDKIYKLINYLIQGSAADMMKDAIIEWDAQRGADVHFLVSVYDEINISAPVEYETHSMKVLREIMEIDRLSVPVRSSGKRGDSWGSLVKCA